MPSLTRTEAADRARIVDVNAYSVDLDLSAAARDEAATFVSTTTIRFGCTAPGSSTFVEVKPHTLRSVTLNGVAIVPSLLDDNRLALHDLAAENELVVNAEMAYSNTGEGLHRFVDPADKETYLYAMTFLDDGQRMFACFDQPDLKAPFTFRATVPEHWTVLSNESGTQVAPGRWEFAETKPLATYFATLVAGPYHSRYHTHDGIRLGIHARRSLSEHLDRHADELFTVTSQSFDYYHRIFGTRYPFGDKYDQAWVPEFNAGAMENPGCVTARDELIFRSAVTDSERQGRAVTIAHEMAHMWFGDLVTMTWWDDLWLNESFADYMGERTVAHATRFTGAETAFTAGGKAWAYIADQRPSTHPISADVPDAANALTNFDGISYAKGQSVLRQLVAWLGDEVFLTGLRDHFDRHAYANAKLADLLDSLGAASGRDLTEWARVWLREPQVNTLRPETDVDAAGDGYRSVVVGQTAPADYPVLRPHQIGVGLYDRMGDKVVRRERIDIEIAPKPSTPIAALRGTPRPDLLLLNDGDLTYAKVRFDSASLAALPDLLPDVEDDTARALLWFTTLDMMRDGEWPASRYVALVAANVAKETDVAIVKTLLRQAARAADRFVAPVHRPAALTRLHGACRSMLTKAEPGSDLQLAAAGGLISSTTTDVAATLRGWLGGIDVPDGLVVDADLRWRILLRLVILGEAGRDDIETEALADATSEGAKSAARCRAALPDQQAKEAAWQLLTVDRSPSNYTIEATAQGFWQPEHSALTEPFVERYFAEIVAATSWRTPWMANEVGHGAYPWHPISRSTLDLAAELLTRDDMQPILRRAVVDESDDGRRTLAARDVDTLD